MATAAEFERTSPHTFVLWGENFDTTAAVIFVCALRREGVRVKIVGLAGYYAEGLHKVALNADLTLGDALDLSAQASCLIVPCNAGVMRRFENDPRLFQFFQRVCLPHTRIIMKESSTLEAATLAQLAVLPDQLTIYDASEDLLGFAHSIAQTLATELWAT